MIYNVKWTEEVTNLVEFSGIIEANSEHEVKERVKHGDVDEILDSYEIDCLGTSKVKIKSIELEGDE